MLKSIIFCVGIVGNIQVIKIDDKVVFLKDRKVKCERLDSTLSEDVSGIIESPNESQSKLYNKEEGDYHFKNDLPDNVVATNKFNSFKGKYRWIWLQEGGILVGSRYSNDCIYERFFDGSLTPCSINEE